MVLVNKSTLSDFKAVSKSDQTHLAGCQVAAPFENPESVLILIPLNESASSDVILVQSPNPASKPSSIEF